ncbi:MAG: DUF1585 domain-containing protein [Planctomycetaceae bacterium]|nr:DUF1585 domain-containing protein [Planctomycetaceae bacterium]
MLSYALRRPLTFRDEQIMLDLQSEFKAGGHNTCRLIKAIVTSDVLRQGSQSKTHELSRDKMGRKVGRL